MNSSLEIYLLRSMIESPNSNFISCINHYAKLRCHKISTVKIKQNEFPSVTISESDLYVFCDTKKDLGIKTFKEFIKDVEPEAFRDESLYRITVIGSRLGSIPEDEQIFGRGKKVVGFHDGLAQLLSMQDEWGKMQETYLNQALDPLKIDGKVQLADLYLRIDDNKYNALNWLEDHLSGWKEKSSKITYLRAEAGKGKSTLLAEITRRMNDGLKGPLTLYVPLRNLKRGSGISWAGIAGCAGIMGRARENLKDAVRAGLVSLVLDGLDEVAGRYDPNTIQQLAQVVLNKLKSSDSRIVMSGRTTEATILDKTETRDIGIELPDTEERSFEEYSDLVIRSITPEWPNISSEIDDLSIQKGNMTDDLPSDRQRKDILDWIKLVFDDLGKERSLFFIQSLACIGRSYQSDNQPFLIRGTDDPARMRPPLMDVCLLAAGLACYREKDKIEQIGKKYFSAYNQVKILTFLALLASAEDSLRAEMPRPNEIAERIVGVDPINENERFVAVTRQLQRHALLFSDTKDATQTGDWRPSFLSDWVRSALIVRAWNQLNDFNELNAVSDTATKIIARAEKAHYAYEYIIPELIYEEGQNVRNLPRLVDLLKSEAEKGSPEASANFWRLYLGADEDTRQDIRQFPKSLATFSDLSGVSGESVEVDHRFSGSYSFFVEAEFRSSSFKDCSLSQSDFTRSVFENCEFQDVEIKFCDGPITFDNCTFANTRFENVRQAIPGYNFVDCEFGEGCSIVQTEPSIKNDFGAIASFEGCVTHSDIDDFIEGDVTGLQKVTLSGLVKEEESEVSKTDKCLRSLLKRFFERWAGESERRQARDYIRTSSLGRGVWPDGSPTKTQLEKILLSMDFIRGGRSGHIWAPWSQLAGGGAREREIRTQLLLYLQNSEESQYVKELKEKIQDNARW